MKSNVGSVDGFLRTLLFIFSVCYAVYTGSWWIVIIGAVLFETAIFTWCPIYETTGINTNSNK